MAAQVMAGMFGAADAHAGGIDAVEARALAERRARRGPTPEIFFTKRMDNSRLIKAQCPHRTREMRSFAGAMVMLFLLVMFYGWQHLSSIEYGYKVESAKQRVAQLQEENRRLRLTEAQLGDPARIDRMARELGLSSPQPGQVIRPENSTAAEAPSLAMTHAPVLGR